MKITEKHNLIERFGDNNNRKANLYKHASHQYPKLNANDRSWRIGITERSLKSKTSTNSILIWSQNNMSTFYVIYCFVHRCIKSIWVLNQRIVYKSTWCRQKSKEIYYIIHNYMSRNMEVILNYSMEPHYHMK